MKFGRFLRKDVGSNDGERWEKAIRGRWEKEAQNELDEGRYERSGDLKRPETEKQIELHEV